MAKRRPWQERFHEKVDRSGGPDACWPWIGARKKSGGRGHYGVVRIDGTLRTAHRVAWHLVNGEPPEGMLLRHRCDNPPCCNLAHLELGLHADNLRDAVERGRRIPGAVLLVEQVAEIRQLRAGGAKVTEIAARFGVNKSTVSRLARGLSRAPRKAAAA